MVREALRLGRYCRYGITLSMCYRLHWYNHLWAQSVEKVEEPTLLHGIWHFENTSVAKNNSKVTECQGQ